MIGLFFIIVSAVEFEMVVVKDLPFQLSPKHFAGILQEVEFHPGANFDVLHIPQDKGNLSSGYAFINGDKIKLQALLPSIQMKLKYPSKTRVVNLSLQSVTL